MRKIQIPQQHFEALVGRLDENLKALEKALSVRVSARGNEVFIEGEENEASTAENLLTKMIELQENGYTLGASDVRTAAGLLQQDPALDLKKFFLNNMVVPSSKKN